MRYAPVLSLSMYQRGIQYRPIFYLMHLRLFASVHILLPRTVEEQISFFPEPPNKTTMK
jgi:hypothetical protein